MDVPMKWTAHPVHPIAIPMGAALGSPGRFVCLVGTNRVVMVPEELDAFQRSGKSLAAVIGPAPGGNKDKLEVLISDRTVLMTPDELASYYHQREEGIFHEQDEPLIYGYEAQHWRDADALLEEYNILCIFGGNQASKTEYLGKRTMQHLATKEDWNSLLLQNNELASKQLHQKLLWKYMPKEWKTGKRRRGAEGNIGYDPKTGFADNLFTTDLRGTQIFGNYAQTLDKYEGLQFNWIGPDENMPLKWFDALKRGLSTRRGKMVWAFTPITGMTPAIAALVTGARTLKSLPVDPRLKGLGDVTMRHVADCPPGHMPYIAVRGEVAIIYFHSSLNAFGDYENLRSLYGHKSKEESERRFFGFARKLQRVSFPKFGDNHVKKHADLVARIAEQAVTWYHLSDPAGARNMFQIWIAVDADGRHYVTREWPDVVRFGEWAVPSENPRLWDGEPGPAQTGSGLSVRSYKRIILEEEGNRFQAGHGWIMCGQTIFMRYTDPRAGRNQTIGEEDNGTSLIDRFAEEQEAKDGSGVIDGPSMDLVPAPGFREGKGIDGDDQEGKQGINDLLDYDEEEPITRGINEPMLLISDECQQLIWALQNYTGNDGDKAACKDPIDVLRYAATAKLEHVAARLIATGGGSY